MADNIFLLDSPAIERAVMAHNTVNYPPRRFGKSSLNEIPAVTSGGVGYEYNGQHKLILKTTANSQGVNSYSVYVADGATFDPETGNSDTSRVEVNGVSFDLAAKRFTLGNSTLYIYVTFSAATSSVSASVKYETGDSLPPNSSLKSYYLIGRCVYADGTFIVQQDHVGASSNGIVRINWGRACNVE